MNRWDKTGRYGVWTVKVLKSLLEAPGQTAQWHSLKLNMDKEWLKLNIRKLKNLGLTISLEKGYEISPRGKDVLRRLIHGE